MEVSAGGQAPRVHSIDDYFMVDVEQDGDEGAGSKRRGSAAVTAQEYQYDGALEPSYWKSLLRAAGKTLGDGHHPMVLLDAPALKAEQVREVWKVVQGAGAELLVVNPLTTDPEVSVGVGTWRSVFATKRVLFHAALAVRQIFRGSQLAA